MILLKISPKKLDQLEIWMGHFCLKNWYLYGFTFKSMAAQPYQNQAWVPQGKYDTFIMYSIWSTWTRVDLRCYKNHYQSFVILAGFVIIIFKTSGLQSWFLISCHIFFFFPNKWGNYFIIHYFCDFHYYNKWGGPLCDWILLHTMTVTMKW